MANTLRFKRGLLAGLPSAAVGEPLFTTDTFDLYIGTASGTQKYQKFIASGTTSQLLRGDGSLLTMPIVLTSPSNGQVLKYNGTSWVNDSDAGITGSGAAGQVAYFTGATTQGGSNNLFWDASNSRLGIGTNTPSWSLDISTAGATISRVRGGSANNQGAAYFVTQGGSNTSLLAIGDGSTMVGGAVNNAMIYVNGSPLSFSMGGTTQMTLTSVGRLLLGSTSDNGLRFQVTGDGYFSGSVGIGTSSITAYNLRNNKNITGGTTAFGHSVDGIVQTDVSSFAIYNHTVAQTTAGGTYANLAHYNANQGGIGGTLTNQFGYRVAATLTGATNNFGFYGDIAAGTGRWNLYMNGTAANYLGGNLGIGVTVPAGGIDVNNPRSYFRNSGSTGTAIRIISTFTNGRDWGIGGNYVGGNGEFSIYDYTANAERLQINASGNLGLGVTPSTWAASRSKIEFSSAGTTAGFVGCFAGSSANNQMGLGSNAYYNASSVWTYSNTGGGAGYYAVKNNVHEWHIAPSGTAGNPISFVQAMTLDASGNLGLGVTPSAWGGLRALQVGNQTALVNSGFYTWLGTNWGGSGDVYLQNGFATIYRQQSGEHAWFTAPSGTAGNAITFTQRMTLHQDGNLYLGTGTTNAGYKLDVNGTMRVSGASTFSSTTTTSVASGLISIFDSTNVNGGYIVLRKSNVDNLYIGNRAAVSGDGGTGYDFYSTSGLDLRFFAGATKALTLATTGAATFSSSVTANDVLTASSTGGGTSAIFRNLGAQNSNGIELRGGTAGTSVNWKIEKDNTVANAFQITPSTTNGGTTYTTPSLTILNTGAATFSGNVGIGGTPAQRLDVQGSANSIQARFGNVAGRGLTIGTSAISGTNDAGVVFNAPTATDGTLVFQTSSTDRMTLNSSGLNVATAIAIGTTPDTNKPFKILKNINDTVGIRFENTSTGNVAYSAVQFGTDVTGGTKFANLVYSSSGITESGAYKQNGTSIINTGTGGLNLLAVDGTIRFFTSSSNGTLRAEIANDGFINHYTGTAPSTNLTDGYRQYSADITAGNAAPHFRTENGGIIKLYQQTTGVTSATYIGGAGTGLTDSDTFDGYTIAQIVKALRNAGLLA